MPGEVHAEEDAEKARGERTQEGTQVEKRAVAHRRNVYCSLTRSSLPLLPPAVLELAEVVVVDQEEVAPRVEGPTQAGVRAEGAVLSVVLQEAVELEVRREVEAHLGPHDGQVEVALLQAADVPLRLEKQGDEGRRGPRRLDLDLVERTGVEASEPPRRLPGQLALGRGLHFGAVAVPVIGAGRDDDPVRDLERLRQPLAGRAPS